MLKRNTKNYPEYNKLLRSIILEIKKTICDYYYKYTILKKTGNKNPPQL